MILPKFDFHEPATVSEACQILSEFGNEAKLIAGGTDVIVNMKKKIWSPKQLVSINRIEELQKVEKTNGSIEIGSCCTVAELAASELIREKLCAVCESAVNLGSPLIRNLATIGGNLGSARPAAELPPSLMAYGAHVGLKNRSSSRIVDLNDFFTGPGTTVLQADEIIVDIQVDTPPPYSGAGYLNLGVRKANDINIVNVASFLALDGPEGVILSARIVMGCVGPKHLRATSAEKLLVGQKPTPELFAEAGKVATNDCTPISDFRGSAEYKKDMAGVLAKKTLTMACNQAINKKEGER
ncbi:MAG: xanthine dehydrogenase family protein subunit M [Proteobacteria bacterium]|nr:xanthine dehydrogenase family protein subunit M [Pseudomonadota bacterium]